MASCLNQEIFYSLKEAQIVVEQIHRSDIGHLRRRHPQAINQLGSLCSSPVISICLVQNIRQVRNPTSGINSKLASSHLDP
jgi:hypothetical protein